MVVSRVNIRNGEFESSLRAPLTERGWHFARCVKCGREFYARRPGENCRDVRLGCAADYGFVGRRERVRYRSPAEVLSVIRDGMAGLGFTETTVGDPADTFFVIAGVQVFDPVLAGDAPPTRERFFVPQPCVRVKSLEKVGRRPGISSSFVNLCTEELDGSLVIRKMTDEERRRYPPVARQEKRPGRR